MNKSFAPETRKQMSENQPKQVKSKQRVADHDEVFTAEREVNAMLDLVKPGIVYIR